VLLFDYRLKHYGQSNRSDHARPVLYLTYVDGCPASKHKQNSAQSLQARLPMPGESAWAVVSAAV
jgi:hypothetical protein